jgi:hypothetical protein
MTALEKDIFNSLVHLEQTVAALPTMNPKPDLQPIFSHIDQLTRQLPANTDPELLHFLHKRSYQKAKLLLEGQGAQNARGSCGH